MAFFAVSVTSCNDDEEEYSADYLLNIAEENLNISAPAEASSYEVEIVARAIWKATVTTDSGEEWITLTTGSDTGGYNTLAFDHRWIQYLGFRRSGKHNRSYPYCHHHHHLPYGTKSDYRDTK